MARTRPALAAIWEVNMDLNLCKGEHLIFMDEMIVIFGAWQGNTLPFFGHLILFRTHWIFNLAFSLKSWIHYRSEDYRKKTSWWNLYTDCIPNGDSAFFQLSRTWLNDTLTERRVSLQDLVLVLSFKFLPPEATLRRVPTGKSSGLFGTNIAVICRWVTKLLLQYRSSLTSINSIRYMWRISSPKFCCLTW